MKRKRGRLYYWITIREVREKEEEEERKKPYKVYYIKH
jgi:hypothetical protein